MVNTDIGPHQGIALAQQFSCGSALAEFENASIFCHEHQLEESDLLTKYLKHIWIFSPQLQVANWCENTCRLNDSVLRRIIIGII